MQKPLYLDTDDSLEGNLDVGGCGNDSLVCDNVYKGVVESA